MTHYCTDPRWAMRALPTNKQHMPCARTRQSDNDDDAEDDDEDADPR